MENENSVYFTDPETGALAEIPYGRFAELISAERSAEYDTEKAHHTALSVSAAAVVAAGTAVLPQGVSSAVCAVAGTVICAAAVLFSGKGLPALMPGASAVPDIRSLSAWRSRARFLALAAPAAVCAAAAMHLTVFLYQGSNFMPVMRAAACAAGAVSGICGCTAGNALSLFRFAHAKASGRGVIPGIADGQF